MRSKLVGCLLRPLSDAGCAEVPHPFSTTEWPPSTERLCARVVFILDDLDAHVASSFERAVAALQAAGADVTRAAAPCFDRAHALYAGGGFAGPEAAQIHRPLLAAHRAPPDVERREGRPRRNPGARPDLRRERRDGHVLAHRTRARAA